MSQTCRSRQNLLCKSRDRATNIVNSFAGEVVTPDTLDSPEKQAAYDFGSFMGRHNKDARGPEIFAAAKALKHEMGYKKIGAIGFCYGGWGTLQLAGKGQSHVQILYKSSFVGTRS